MEFLELYVNALKEIHPQSELEISYTGSDYWVHVGARYIATAPTMYLALSQSVKLFLARTNSKSAWTVLNEFVHGRRP